MEYKAGNPESVIEDLKLAIDLYKLPKPFLCVGVGLLNRVAEAARQLSFEKFLDLYKYVMENQDELPRDFIDEIKFQGELRGLCEAPGG